jgi:hypothetical protein
MDKDTSRGDRLKHIERLKKARAHYWGRNLTNDAKALGKLAHTAALCSCEMCCNPRRSGFNKGKGRLTMQELRHLDKMKAGLE